MSHPPTEQRTLLPIAALALAAALSAVAVPAAAEIEPLTLRVNDAIAVPGGVAAMVVRTYASRPVGQGQLCFLPGCRTRARAGIRCAFGYEPPISYLEGHLVFSVEGDAQSQVLPDKEQFGQAVVLNFLSPSATVNAADGPLTVLFFRVPRSARPGTTLPMLIDAANTILVDEAGNEVVLDVKSGSLTIRAPGDPIAVEADGDRILPGEVAHFGVQTFEAFGISGGQVGLRYDPAIAAGPPVVRFDHRYGNASFTVDLSEPGLILVTFRSADNSLNYIPGELISVALPTSAAVAPGTQSAIWLDPQITYLVTGGDEMPDLALAGGVIEFDID